MNEKIKNIFKIIIVIIVILFAILWYPLFVKTENGKTHCYNILGYETTCR